MQIDLKCKLIIRSSINANAKEEREKERFFILFNFYTKLDSYGRKKIWRKKEVG